jgi:hypothetical protein
VLLFSGCAQETQEAMEDTIVIREETIEVSSNFPKIASWVAKKDEIITSGKPYSFVMGDWFTAEEAEQIKSKNPDAKLLAGATINWVHDSSAYKGYIETLGNFGKSKPIKIKEDMYLIKPNGQRCAFGWSSGEFNQGEFYVMDLRNSEWIELITSFYKNILDQPHHDGITIDMISDASPCPEAISDKEWQDETINILVSIKNLNSKNKLVIINSGGDIKYVAKYAEFFDGYLMEKFLSTKPFKPGWPLGATFTDGLKAADSNHIVIYDVDTDDTGEKDLEKMRLGLTLSLLNDNTYFTYDFGPRDHGQAWWFPEYDAELGEPLGKYYKKDDGYYREFENGIVVCSPVSDIIVIFDEEYTDITTNIKSTSFTIAKGDGRIFIK